MAARVSARPHRRSQGIWGSRAAAHTVRVFRELPAPPLPQLLRGPRLAPTCLQLCVGRGQGELTPGLGQVCGQLSKVHALGVRAPLPIPATQVVVSAGTLLCLGDPSSPGPWLSRVGGSGLQPG